MASMKNSIPSLFIKEYQKENMFRFLSSLKGAFGFISIIFIA